MAIAAATYGRKGGKWDRSGEEEEEEDRVEYPEPEKPFEDRAFAKITGEGLPSPAPSDKGSNRSGSSTVDSRTPAEKIMEKKWFKYTVWTTILCAMLLMMVDSQYAGYACSPAAVCDESNIKWTVGNWRPDLLNSLDVVCSLVFTIEAVILILGRGFVPYFTNPRNIVQFVIVWASWAKTIVFFAGGPTGGNLAACLGALRALRPVMVLTNQPDLNSIMLCLIRAVLALSSIGTILIFFFVIFGLIGMQMTTDRLRYRCMWNGNDTIDYLVASFEPYNLTDENGTLVDEAGFPHPYCCSDYCTDYCTDYVNGVPANFTTVYADENGLSQLTLFDFGYDVYNMSENAVYGVYAANSEVKESRWLQESTMSGPVNVNGDTDPYYHMCNPTVGSGVNCAEYFDRTIAFNGENLTLNSTGNLLCNDTGVNGVTYGQPINFDNFGWAVITLFVSIIAVGWTDIQYQYQDAYFWGWALFFSLVMVVGLWVILNLAIAVLADAYNDQKAEEEAAEKAKRVYKRAARREAKDAGEEEVKKPPTFMERWEAKSTSPEAIVKRATFHRIVDNQCFKIFYLVLILASTIHLATYTPTRRGSQREAWEAVGWSFVGLFWLEQMLKTVGLGTYRYYTDSAHLFDAALNLLSLGELLAMAMGYTIAGTGDGTESYNLSVVHACRVLRIFRLAAAWEAFKEVLLGALRSVKAVTAIAVVLFVVLFFFSVVSMQLFGGLYGAGGIVVHNNPLHFDYFLVALATIFQVITTENWIGVMWGAYGEFGPGAIVFFFIVIIVGNIVILNMFLAILLDQMAHELSAKKDELERQRKINDWAENRAALKMQQMLRANKFLTKLKKNVQNKDDTKPSGAMTGVSGGDPDYPLLSGWEISQYKITWDKVTSANGGKLPIEDLHKFLTLIGQRLLHAPERVAREVEKQYKEIQAAHVDEDGDGCIELWEVLKILNRKRMKEIQIARRKGLQGQAAREEDQSISRIPARSLCCDPNVAMLHPLVGNGCGMGPKSGCRHRALLLLYSPVRKFLTAFFIFLSGSMSGMRFTQVARFGKHAGYRSSVEKTLGTETFDSIIYFLDFLFLVLLFVEIVLMMIVRGVFSPPPAVAYFRRNKGFGWRLCDCFICLTALIALSMDLSGATPDDSSNGARPYKFVQALKMVCLIPRTHVTKVMVSAILESAPKVAMMFLATMLVLFAFAVMGVFMFGGMFGSCGLMAGCEELDDGSGYACPGGHFVASTYFDLHGRINVCGEEFDVAYPDCDQLPDNVTFINTRAQCEEIPGMEWGLANPNFDYVARGCGALFQVMFIDGWSGILGAAMASRGFEKQPFPESRLEGPLLYFWFWIVIGALFFLNLIVGTVVSSFMEVLDEDSGLAPLTDEQRRWVHTQKVLQGAKMVRLFNAPIDGCLLGLRRFFFRMCTARREVASPDKKMSYNGDMFNGFIMTVIIFNVGAMLAFSTSYGPQTQSLYANFGILCTGIYYIEFVVKWFGLGKRQYLMDKWNWFDLTLVVLGTVFSVIPSVLLYLGLFNFTLNTGYLKALRLFRLGKYSRSIRLLVATLSFGAPALMNITLVLWVVLYIFAMIGMVLFGGMVHSGSCAVSKHANFDNAYMSVQTIFRLATGDSWSCFYLDAMNNNYPEWIIAPGESWVHAFFVIFMFTSLIFISIFIAIILEYYGIQTALVISELERSTFSEEWIKYDPENTAFMPVFQLGEFLDRVGYPFSPIEKLKPAGIFSKPRQITEQEIQERRDKVRDFLKRIAIPVRAQGKVHFIEVLVALSEKKEGHMLPAEGQKIQETLLASWPKNQHDLLSLPPREAWSKEFIEEMMAVLSGADWVLMQEDYNRKLLGQDKPKEEPKTEEHAALAPQALKSMPSMAKLHAYLSADDVDPNDVQSTLKTLKEAEAAQPAGAPMDGLPMPQPAAQLQLGGGFARDTRPGPVPYTKSASLLALGQKPEPAYVDEPPPVMSSHLIDAWVRIRTDLQSEDADRQLTGLVLIRKLLSSTGKAKHMQVFRGVLANECVARFVFFLQEADTPTLQYEAAWALTHICTDPQCVQAVVQNGALPVIVQLSRSPHDNVAIQALHAIGNICKDTEMREMLMVQGALQVVLEQLNPHTKLPVLRMATWSLSCICGAGSGGPGRSWAMVAPAALTILPHLLGSDDDELLTQACRALAALGEALGPSSLVNCDHIQSLIETNCLPRVVKLMARPGVELPKAALRVAANIVTGDDAQAQTVVDAGALPVMGELLKQTDKTIRKECCWALSSIMAGTEEQLQAVVEADLFGQIVRLLSTEGPSIQKESAWCIINGVSGGNTAQIKYFVENGAIKALCDLLIRSDLMSPAQPLEALEYVLKHGKHSGESYMALVDVFKLKQLGEHGNPDVRKRAIRILDMVVNAAPFFGGESNVFIPSGLLTDQSAAHGSPQGGALVKHASARKVAEADMQAAWSKKWEQAPKLVQEADEDTERVAATEALADTMYLDFFGGDDPFGVMDGAEEDEDDIPVVRSSRRGSRRGGSRSSRRGSADV